ncbi:MAG: class I SAM-dependent methyltransferase [Ignavibacteriaceae bacterium]|nr:class I SAM-dependent methyltransferase [Ignavibacteriaceae bacterium]
MTWYKDWFNSKNYLKLYKHRDNSEAERLVGLIEKNVNLKPQSSVLDMACGAGRHAIAFAKNGFNVTAVDLSERLLEEAKKNAITAEVNIDFSLSDILKFETDRKFDLAVNLFTSIGYFEDDKENFAVIKKANSLIKVGGFFVLDYFNKDFLLKNLVPTSIISENGLKITQNRSISGNRVVKKIIIEKDGSIEEFYESVRLYSHEEIQSIVKCTGFNIIKEIGDFYGNAYEEETSPRLILFAKK